VSSLSASAFFLAVVSHTDSRARWRPRPQVPTPPRARCTHQTARLSWVPPLSYCGFRPPGLLLTSDPQYQHLTPRRAKIFTGWISHFIFIYQQQQISADRKTVQTAWKARRQRFGSAEFWCAAPMITATQPTTVVALVGKCAGRVALVVSTWNVQSSSPTLKTTHFAQLNQYKSVIWSPRRKKLDTDCRLALARGADAWTCTWWSS